MESMRIDLFPVAYTFCDYMAAENSSSSEKANESGVQNEKLSKSSKVRLKSKRRRFQDDNDEVTSGLNSELQNLLARQLSDYLDRNIEEIIVTQQDEDSIQQEKQADGFQLFSSLLQTSTTSIDSPTSKETPHGYHNNSAERIDSSSSEDDASYAKLKEAAVSVQDIFGSADNLQKPRELLERST